ncbi:gp6 domain containing protein [uncultured Caudovirales phage]|uniref:Gp6 domain containing protein n=1 Tax=uncultured Caudovirales phage TaxID=2100421 RepID=A0A6J5M4D2_9CAUD|nr:gp6 domain containing protein [uncultured Caudovirales phage]
MAVENQTLAPFYANQRNPYNYAKIEQVARDLMTEWLTIDEITQQLNLFDDESQDSYLSGLELATRMAIEDYLGQAVFPTQYKVYYPNFGLYNTAIYLDLPEVSAPLLGQPGVVVNKLECYTTSNTVPVLIAPNQYSYDPTGNQVIVTALPNALNQQVANPVVLTYTQNRSPIANYPVVKQAGLMLLTHLYNNRSTVGDSVAMKAQIPFGVDQLLRPYKTLVM